LLAWINPKEHYQMAKARKKLMHQHQPASAQALEDVRKNKRSSKKKKTRTKTFTNKTVASNG
jgi:hypothetical protein